MLISTLHERGIRYAIVGGIALIQHTRVRTTDDIDVLLAVPQVELPGFFDALRQRGFALETERSIREICDSGVTLVRLGSVIVDLMRPVIPAFGRVLDRAVDAEVLGQHIRIASAEGLIVMKLAAMRPQDQMDIQDLFAAYGGGLDLMFIRHELATFTPAEDPRREQLERWIRDLFPSAERSD
jgi:hypothetical protein